ncbi:MAG: porin family protein [Pseudomonadota bacterium]|nr:porin family protein [Pseudomonadota bacterium]
MRTLSFRHALMATSLALPLSAVAETGVQFYYGLQLGQASVEATGLDDSYSFTSGRAGFQFHPNLGVEARVGVGLDNEETMVGAVRGESEVDQIYSLYGVATYPANERLDLYALVGMTEAGVTVRAGGVSMSEDESGLSYGVGAAVALTPNIDITAEYLNLLDEDAIEAQGVTLGLQFHY